MSPLPALSANGWSQTHGEFRRNARLKASRSLITALVTLALGAGACSSGQPLTPAEVGELQARAIERACEKRCAQRILWVEDAEYEFGTEIDDVDPMPTETAEAIRQLFPGVSFLAPGAWPPGTNPTAFDDGIGAVAHVGPIARYPNNIVGIEVGTSVGRDYFATAYLFKWDGSQWQPTTPEETGISVRTAMS